MVTRRTNRASDEALGSGAHRSALPEGADRIAVASRDELRGWLGRHGDRKDGIWLITAKKGHADYLAYDFIVEELIAYGWVDGQPRGLDDTHSARRIAPRDPSSTWSKANRERVARLEEAGAMTERGRALVEAAKRNGAWDRTTAAEDGRVPDDLAAALDRAGASETFDGFPPSSKRIILEWIAEAKTDRTRTKRIEETTSEAKLGRRAHHYRR